MYQNITRTYIDSMRSTQLNLLPLGRTAKVVRVDCNNKLKNRLSDLGLYEGGFVGYDYGIFRPSDDSVMNSTANQTDYFNAPSRWAIYMHIMRLAGEPCSFEDFLEYDKKNIGKQGEESAVHSVNKTEPIEEIWYDLQGRRIKTPQRRGIYIKNGKKYLY